MLPLFLLFCQLEICSILDDPALHQRLWNCQQFQDLRDVILRLQKMSSPQVVKIQQVCDAWQTLWQHNQGDASTVEQQLSAVLLSAIRCYYQQAPNNAVYRDLCAKLFQKEFRHLSQLLPPLVLPGDFLGLQSCGIVQRNPGFQLSFTTYYRVETMTVFFGLKDVEIDSIILFSPVIRYLYRHSLIMRYSTVAVSLNHQIRIKMQQHNSSMPQVIMNWRTCTPHDCGIPFSSEAWPGNMKLSADCILGLPTLSHCVSLGLMYSNSWEWGFIPLQHSQIYNKKRKRKKCMLYQFDRLSVPCEHLTQAAFRQQERIRQAYVSRIVCGIQVLVNRVYDYVGAEAGPLTSPQIH